MSSQAVQTMVDLEDEEGTGYDFLSPLHDFANTFTDTYFYVQCLVK